MSGGAGQLPERRCEGCGQPLPPPPPGLRAPPARWHARCRPSQAPAVRLAGEKRRRRRRPTRARARTLSQRYTKRALAAEGALFPEQPGTDYLRPPTRGDCAPGGGWHHRPCPYVSCAHHLYLDVHPRSGNLKLNFPDIEVEAMGESCVLDVADREGATLEETAAALNLTRERVRQIELRALAKVAAAAPALAELTEHGATGRRRLPLLPGVR